MKKTFTLVIIGCMCLLIVACGKSAAAKDADEAIAAIGEVTLESEEAIATAEKLYGILTENEKSTVENRLALADAREQYDKLVAEKEAKDAESEKLRLSLENMAEGIKNYFKDPDSVQIAEAHVAEVEGSEFEYYAIANVRAKNSFGGYAEEAYIVHCKKGKYEVVDKYYLSMTYRDIDSTLEKYGCDVPGWSLK